LATDAHSLTALVRRWSKHSHLSPDDRSALLALPYTRKSFGKDAYIVREGQQTNDCALLLKGFAFRQKLLRNGSRQIISIHIPTEFVDLQNALLGMADHNVQSVDHSEAAIIPRAQLMDLAASHPAIRKAMWIDTLIDASIFREWVVNVGRRNSRSRIAHLLCEFAYRLSVQGTDPPGHFELPITQEQLADATGLTAVHVNRVLKGLEADGLIDRNRRIISFPNWQRLRDVGDFNPRYLHAPELAP
jgi:CRP-like cAMP-binding protein